MENATEAELFGCPLERGHVGRISYELDSHLKEEYSSQKEQQVQSLQGKSVW